MAKLSSKGLVGIAFVLSFVIAVLIYNFLSSLQKQAVAPTETVLTARFDILPKTAITAEMLQESKVLPEYIQPGAVRSLAQAVGVVARETIIAGEQVVEGRLLRTGKTAGFTGLIPSGKRAMTVGISEITGVAGLLKAGDSVDAIVTFDQQVAGDNVGQILLQNVLVLAVNRDTEVAQEREAKNTTVKDYVVGKMATVTLALSPQEAAQIALAEEKGKLRFALRPYLPETEVVIKRPVTPSDLVGIHKSPLDPPKDLKTPAAAATAPAAAAPAKPQSSIPVIRGTKIE